MIRDIAIGLAGAAGIVVAGRIVDALLRRGSAGRWVAPEAWLVLLVVWNVAAAAVVASGFDDTSAALGSSADDLRRTATLGGTPLIALAGVVVLARWRLMWSRRRIRLVQAVAALAVIDLIGVVVGFASGNASHYIASDAWRWAVLPLFAVLALGEQRPRPWLLALSPAAVGATTIILNAPWTIDAIGDGSEPGPVSTLTICGTAVALAWAACARPRWVLPLGLLLTLELIITLASASRTALVLALVMIGLALASVWSLRAAARAAAAVVLPCALIALAIATVDPVDRWADPVLERWEIRAAEEIVPQRGPVQREPEPTDTGPQPERPPPGTDGRDEEPRGDRDGRGGRDKPVQPKPPAPQPTLKFSSVGERREEVETSIEWQFRGSLPLDALRLVVGLGQGAQYSAPRLPALDNRSKTGFRHHIHVSYVNALVRNGLTGVVAVVALLALLLLTAARGMREFASESTEGLAARVIGVGTIAFTLEMVTGFVFIGSVEGGALVAGAVALAVVLTHRRPAAA